MMIKIISFSFKPSVRVRPVTLGLLCILIPLIFASPSIASGEDGEHIFQSALLARNAVSMPAADGIYGTMTTISGMDAPTSGSQAATTVPSGQSLEGNNVRFFQLNDNHSGNGEFFGIGYVAGAVTGTNAARGVYKDLYADGTSCSTTSSSSCSYSENVNTTSPISQGQTHTFQIQRVQANGIHVFRFWLDNNQFQDRNELMQSGAVSVGSERNFLPAYSAQTVNMAGDFTDLNYHQYGDASSSPPGHLNYTRPSGISYQFQHSACTTTPVEAASGTYMYQVTNSGRC